MSNSAEMRLDAPYGSRLNRQQTVDFHFDSQPFTGLQGDCIASALAANGCKVLSRSFKYHRPRGILSMAGQDSNTLVQLPNHPNAHADRELIQQGLRVLPQNVSGSLRRDRLAWVGKLARFLPVGFYYKAFFRPRGMWEKWAPFFRRQTGLGILDTAHKPAFFDKKYRFTDVCVVGAGPAGMRAALSLADAGLQVTLVDENPEPGGSLCYARFAVDNDVATQQLQSLVAAIVDNENIELLMNATVNGLYEDNWLAIVQAQRLHKLRCRQCIVCAGSLEQPALFHNNDLPGIMFASAAQRLLRLYAVKPGHRAVVYTGSSEGYALALDLIDAGVDVRAIVDSRPEPPADGWQAAVNRRNIRIVENCQVTAARASRDGMHLAAVEFSRVDRPTGEIECIDCDLLCTAVGYTPAYQLLCQRGASLLYDDSSATFSLERLPTNVQIAGSINNRWTIEEVLKDAEVAAANAINRIHGGQQSPVQASASSPVPNSAWPIVEHPKGKEFVDFDEDLQIADLVNATKDGFEHIQLVKRYSTCGMGPSQGRHSALAAARVVAKANERSVSETGVTTARPPFAGEFLAHNAGRSFYPARRSSMHYRHLEAGAQMMQAGAWYRPGYYGAPDAARECIQREAGNVRRNVGMIDVSTLGGIEIRGPQAAEFMNRLYTFGFLKQEAGRARYALMTNEAGVVIDDGVACRLSEQHYYVTATTGGVDRVFLSMLKWNSQWQLHVDVSNVTSAWAAVNVAGPNSRKLLAPLCSDIDLSAPAFPYMAVRTGHVAEIPARLLRVGFVGELGYEIHVPQLYGEALWDRIMDAGKSFDLQPFGVEAQRLLRLEKGHIIIGQDTDAMSHPAEVGMQWAVSSGKPFFVGQRSIQELQQQDQQRMLVGFTLPGSLPSGQIPRESHLVLDGDRMVGRVTSCAYSPATDQVIGLAYVPPRSQQEGQTITIKVDGGQRVSATVAALPFYDPDNRRQELQ